MVRAANGDSRSTSTSVARFGVPSSRAPSIVWPSAPLHHAQAGATTTAATIVTIAHVATTANAGPRPQSRRAGGIAPTPDGR
jgi:hypothetical protein